MNRLKGIIVKLMGVRNRDKIRRYIHKKWGKLVYRKHYNATDILMVMRKMGMKPGDVVFIHSSMREFFNYDGSAEELIKTIEDYLGPEGTISMPAYPKKYWELSPKCLTSNFNNDKSPIMFDVTNTPTGAGYLAETFRKMPGVKRSINLQHSVCAKGKYADYLISEHHLSNTCWDEKSPYYKLTLLNAKIFSFRLFTIVAKARCLENIIILISSSIAISLINIKTIMGISVFTEC